MSYDVIWDEPAPDAAALFLKDDPEGLRQLFASIDLLAECPRPEGSIPYGSPDLRRIDIAPCTRSATPR
ncbi:hypothetical protein [Streptomyces sp. NPDC059122]|uniref:hypothetical protein n=1 Tax=Streptomyces sp. NPDC059122 TaxID=3346732 RepID=UPI0036ACCAB3